MNNGKRHGGVERVLERPGPTRRPIVQLNMRVDAEIVKGVAVLKDMTRWSKETIVETILSSYFGNQNPDVKSRLQMMDRFKEELKLSFKRAGTRTASQEQLAA